MESEWLNCSRKSCIRLKMRLVTLFLLLKFHQPLMTPLLLPKTLKCPLEPANQGIVRTRSSKLMASTHPISCPPPSSSLHLGMSHQALHLFWIVMAMPTPELASEKASIGDKVQGTGMGLDKTDTSLIVHQDRSSEMPLVGRNRLKG